jgi:hypothetical protein
VNEVRGSKVDSCMVINDEELRREAETMTRTVVLIVGLDIGHKALARDLLGCLAEGVLTSPWEGIERSFDR